MMPFSIAKLFVNHVSGQSDDPRILDDDLASHLRNALVPARDDWPLRLLPAFLRTPLKARISARKYEQTLIALWEKSPHLLEDIGVILVPVGGLPDYLIAAPARVVEHVMVHDIALAEQAVAAVQPKPGRCSSAPPVPNFASVQSDPAPHAGSRRAA